MHLWVNLTNRCNLRCSYCFQNETGYRTLGKLSRAMVDRAIEFIESKPIDQITVLGGEACLEDNYLKKLMDFCLKRDVKMGIITNGTIFRDWYAKYRKVLVHVQVSLDGIREVHNATRSFPNGVGSYDLIVQNITKFKKAIGNVDVHTVIPLVNYKNSVDNIEGFLRGLPEDISVGFEVQHGSDCEKKLSLKAAKYFYRVVKALPSNLKKRVSLPRGGQSLGSDVCPAGTSSLSLDVVSGTFYACHEQVGGKEGIVGSLLNSPMFDENKFADVAMKAELGRYRIVGVPKIISSLIKAVVPINICWKQIPIDMKTGIGWISKYEVYLGWMRLRHRSKFAEGKRVE